MICYKSEGEQLIDEFKDDILAVKYREKLRFQKIRVAPDGKRYDVDNLNRELFDNEVEIIQYIRPDAKRRFMTSEVPLDIKKKAKNMIISAEELNTIPRKVAIYVRFKGEDEESEITGVVDNDSIDGESPQTKLIELIEKKHNEKLKGEE